MNKGSETTIEERIEGLKKLHAQARIFEKKLGDLYEDELSMTFVENIEELLQFNHVELTGNQISMIAQVKSRLDKIDDDVAAINESLNEISKYLSNGGF